MRPIFSAFSQDRAGAKNGALGVLVMQPPGTDSPAPESPFKARNLGFSRPMHVARTCSDRFAGDHPGRLDP